MIDLNDKQAIAKIDKKNVYGSVSYLTKQVTQAWEDTQKITFPTDYKQVNNIVLCGMGGSAYAAYVIKALYTSKLRVPCELVNGYDLPAYVHEHTLVLLSSYSGTTEEVLSCGQQALMRKAKITGVCEGGALAGFFSKNNLPAYIFTPINNPAGQPRLGQGYMIFGHMGLLKAMGLLDVSDEEVASAVQFVDEQTEAIEIKAKEIAHSLVEKIPVIVAAEHLSGNAHTLRNQFNETAKNFSAYSLLPELNHHLMEGLVHPEARILIFLFLKSQLYSKIVQTRLTLTKEVVEKNNIATIGIDVVGDSHLSQMLYALSFGGYLTFYLGILYGQDPSVIPWVDFFKEKLSKS